MFLKRWRPPHVPYTTLFRSDASGRLGSRRAERGHHRRPADRRAASPDAGEAGEKRILLRLRPGDRRNDPEALAVRLQRPDHWRDRKSTRLNSSHLVITYAVY